MIRGLRRHGPKVAVAVVGLELTTKLPSEGRSNEYYHAATDRILVPAMRRFLSAENAHDLAVFCLKHGLAPRVRAPTTVSDESSSDDDGDASVVSLSTNVLGLSFPNCVGLAAGFDKDGVAVQGLFDLGFGFVEIGSVTPRPQPGNPKPRVFRAAEDRGIVNRYGFNSVGADEVERNLVAFRAARGSSVDGAGGVLGVNLGKNKTSDDEVADYQRGIRQLGPYADFIVVNVSSPNTPGLRSLQKREPLRRLMRSVVEERNRLAEAGGRSSSSLPPVLVKIAPDLDDDELRDVAAVVRECGVDGVVATNTTSTRPSLSISSGAVAREAGGLSGAPLRALSTERLRALYASTEGRVPIVGVGGIETGADALEKLKAGASLVEVYSVLAYEGPGVVDRIRRELAELLRREGHERVEDVVGLDHPNIPRARRRRGGGDDDDAS